MRRILRLASFVALPLLCTVALAAGPSDAADPVALARKQITSYLDQLADLHCNESVTQQKLSPDGHVMNTVRDQYDYLIMMSGDADEFQLNESRVEADGVRHKLTASSMLVTNGMATALLIFHPYYRNAFEFETGSQVSQDGRELIPIHFTHRVGSRTPLALALRGREFPLDLEGTAWFDVSTRQIVRVEANLQRDMTDVGLKSLSIRVDYKPQLLSGHTTEISLPSQAVVEVATPRQHWRNTHLFTSYKSFSADAEQGASFKVHPNQPASGDDKKPAPDPQGATKPQ